ncbi:MAG: hypothetical protein P0116_11645 [Candidatus Nitrosocosmicus sp.]|nr:hypothetical protein [Candidatus Nitrosocosmicus sp.]
MPQFLFQPDPIDGHEHNLNPMDIHFGVIQIPTKGILDDVAINNTSNVMVGTSLAPTLM